MSWIGPVLQFEAWLLLVAGSWEYCTKGQYKDIECEMSGVVIETRYLGHDWGNILYEIPRTWIKINKVVIKYGFILAIILKFFLMLGEI